MWTTYFQPWAYRVLFIIYVATIISCIAVVLSEKRNPIKSLAWTIALIFLPVAGLVFYIFFGRSLKNKRMISRHNKRKLLSNSRHSNHNLTVADLSPSSRRLIRLASSLGATGLSYATDLKIYTEGKDKFEDLIRDLQGATHSINLQYYIFSNDRLGKKIAAILMDKARSGVKVRVIYDHVGSFSAPNRFFTKMKRAGVEAHPFFRVTFPQLANRINWRNHRKLVIIDNNIGYVGGMNIASRYIDGIRPGKNWRDTHLRIKGPVLSELLYSFTVDWNFLKHHTDITPIPNPGPPAPNTRLIVSQFITSGPTDHWPAIAHLYQRAILSAQKCVYLQTPYFLPTDALLNALETASLSHIDVRVMLPWQSDSKLLNYASYSYITECLRAGIKVYLYTAGMLHAKTLIVDDEFCTSGSTNFDFRSFEYNFEGNLLIYDKEVNTLMKKQFFTDIDSCVKLTFNSWTKRPQAIRFRESIVRLLSPIL